MWLDHDLTNPSHIQHAFESNRHQSLYRMVADAHQLMQHTVQLSGGFCR